MRMRLLSRRDEVSWELSFMWMTRSPSDGGSNFATISSVITVFLLFGSDCGLAPVHR